MREARWYAGSGSEFPARRRKAAVISVVNEAEKKYGKDGMQGLKQTAKLILEKKRPCIRPPNPKP